ncbi:MAG: tolQ, partial [Verrucomicrobiales bacterium]|nr:tolQ [Verrucomicrobiales bacterium]
IIERGLALRWHKVIPPEVESAVQAIKSANDFPMLQQICQTIPSPLSRLLLLAFEHRHWPKAENIETLQTQARHEIGKLERGLVILEIVVGIAPLLGLVGTIYGLILLFGGLGQALNENSQVAAGIALALRATLLGLLTAIPALIAWSYYNKKVESIGVELETLCDLFMRRLYRHAPADTDVIVEKVEKLEKVSEKVEKAKVDQVSEKVEKPQPKAEKAQPKAEKPAEKLEKPLDRAEKPPEKAEKVPEKIEKADKPEEKAAKTESKKV